jgi:hypothetical protein
VYVNDASVPALIDRRIDAVFSTVPDDNHPEGTVWEEEAVVPSDP